MDNFYGFLHRKSMENESTLVHAPTALYNNDLMLWTLMSVLNGTVGQVSSERAYGELLSSVERATNMERTTVQELIYNCASMELFVPLEYLRYFDHGDVKYQFASLKKEPFKFKRQPQIKQLRTLLQTKRRDLLPLQIDGMISILLQEEDSGDDILDVHVDEKKNFQDLIYKNHSPYVAHCNQDGTALTVETFCQITKRTVTAGRFRFEYGHELAHYLPDWAKRVSKSLIWTALRSPNNYRNKNRSKSGNNVVNKWIQRMILEDTRTTAFNDFQKFLNNKNYIVIDDVVHKACDLLGFNGQDLENSISYVSSRDGVTAFLDPQESAMSVKVAGGCDLRSVVYDRIPPFRSCPRAHGLYESEYWAKFALCIHIILNVFPCHRRKHWSSKIVNQAHPGCLLLIAESSKSCYCIIVAFVYLDPTDNKTVMASYAFEDGRFGKSFVVGKESL